MNEPKPAPATFNFGAPGAAMISMTVPAGVTITIPSIHIQIPEGADWYQILADAGLESMFCLRAESRGKADIGTVAIVPEPKRQPSIIDIGAAANDCAAARDAWINADWHDCEMFISNAIARLQAAQAAIRTL